MPKWPGPKKPRLPVWKAWLFLAGLGAWALIVIDLTHYFSPTSP